MTVLFTRMVCLKRILVSALRLCMEETMECDNTLPLLRHAATFSLYG